MRKNKTIAELWDLWDGVNLKCTVRRLLDDRLFLMWEEVFQLATYISFEDSDDALIWKFNSNGLYSTVFI